MVNKPFIRLFFLGGGGGFCGVPLDSYDGRNSHTGIELGCSPFPVIVILFSKLNITEKGNSTQFFNTISLLRNATKNLSFPWFSLIFSSFLQFSRFAMFFQRWCQLVVLSRAPNENILACALQCSQHPHSRSGRQWFQGPEREK